eukprot:scaffold10139_cov74-Cyclotella_meneghiniana.AAC.10
MSFVPPPQKAPPGTANGASVNNNAADAAGVAEVTAGVEDAFITSRTFDLYWVDKSALMYKDGIVKKYDRDERKAVITTKVRSSIPVILRDMAPPEGSIFDPAKKWDEEKERRRQATAADAAAEAKEDKKKPKKNAKKQSTAESIKESNAVEKSKKDLERDLMKLSNLKTLKTLQDANCDTPLGKIHRMVKMLHMAVSDLKQGSFGSSEAEVLDILWALEEMPTFKNAENEISAEKKSKKDSKEDGKKAKKDSKKDSKKEKDGKNKGKEEKTEKAALSAEAKALKELLKDNGDKFKDSLKYARKLMTGKKDIISFQLTQMADRLPPLSRYNRAFKLEDWQCDILGAIDNRKSAVVCAPTSSGKTLLSTYTCTKAKGTIAATYYEFFKGNVTVATDLICFQEISGSANVFIGTPRAVEKALIKARGAAGQEMKNGQREFMILDGGYSQFDYLVLDEVHTLNGPEGDALQRIIRCCNCPFLALSATIGNAQQLQKWLSKVRNEHVEAELIDGVASEEVILKEYFARFINLQRWVVVESEGKDGKTKTKLVKLHPVAAMTPKRLESEPDLIAGLSMTPMDMIDLWKRMKSIFPGTVLDKKDDPDEFFKSETDDIHRISLNETKEYETRLKTRLAALSKSHPELYEKLRQSQLPPPLVAKKDVSDMLYDVVTQLKTSDLLPAVAFQLDTYGAFSMFKTLLARLETEQNAEFPDYRKDLIKLAREKAQLRKVAAGQASRVNAAEAEEDAKSGFTDDNLTQEDTTKPHDKYVLASAGKRLGFNEVEDIIADMKKAGEKVDINHALIRGLRRGIAIYTNEVGFSCYRRQVQILAQKGRLAVVFSDEALAYGVNMPFRSCVFCGDMGDNLTALIAQQMQGRAGRRGMDVQGNVIYLGMEWPYIENLMLGQITKVTGKEPRYPTLALQQAIAAANDPRDTKHFVHDDNKREFAQAIRKIQSAQNCYPTISEEMMEWMAGPSLGDYCSGEEKTDYLTLSKSVVQGLGYVDADQRLEMDHNVLTMVCEMDDLLQEGIHLCAILDQLYMRFCYNKTKVWKESDAVQNEFLSVLLHVVDRVPAVEGEESLQQMLRIVPVEGKPMNDDALAMWLETEEVLMQQKELINGFNIAQSEKDQMQLILPPAEKPGDLGPPLDKGVYEMIITKQKGFREDQSLERRNDIKTRIFKLGHICQIAHNNLQQPHGKYDALEVHFRRLFNNIKYIVADMMNQLTDQADLTEV